jgi:hypothetical protein
MKIKTTLSLAVLTAAAVVLPAKPLPQGISGDYLEVRSCDVYTGSCFANAEMGLTGKEGILVWAIREGSWNGINLAGLNVIAVVRSDGTLGDLRYEPRSGKTVLIVDAKANSEQREALKDMACSLAGKLIKEVVDTKTSAMQISFATCNKAGCASVKAGNLVAISTRCLGGKDHLCGNEQVYYPPLTEVQGAYPAFTELAAYKGNGLNLTWESTGQRSAFLASFGR